MFIAHRTFCSRAGNQRHAGPVRFRCFQGFSILAATLADEAVIDIDPYHGFTVNDFFLMHDHLFDQRVKKFPVSSVISVYCSTKDANFFASRL